ncbi:hypothetical protein ABPG72_005128 [Tetrahymena utriculariae]
MKISVIVLLSLCLTAVLAGDKCQNHQAYLKVKAFLQGIANDNSKNATDAVNNFTSYFENKNPSSSASSDDLGVCSQSGSYTGHQSCCDAKITQFLEKAALFKVKPLQNQNNIVMKFLNALVKIINKSACSAKAGATKPSTANDLINNNSLTNLQALIKNHKTCKVQFATAIVQFTRGAACTVCAGVDQLSSLFDASGNLIISQSSADKFQTAVTAALQCFQNVVSWTGVGGNPGLSDVVNEVLAAYFDNTCATANNIINKIQTIFANKGGVKSAGVCSSTTVFQKQPNCEGAQQGDPTIDSQVSSARVLRQMGFENIRVLQTTDSTTSSASGVSIIVTSPTDSSIDPDGNVDTTTNTLGSSIIHSFLLSSLAVLLLITY